jgi:hypothetical protein
MIDEDPRGAERAAPQVCQQRAQIPARENMSVVGMRLACRDQHYKLEL